MAPSTIEECFYDMIEAFNKAEEYQIPVIVAVDLQLALGKQSCEMLDFNAIEINRGKLVTGELPPLPENQMFKRYEWTEDGISPRVLPGTKNGIHHVTGNEHDQEGRPNEGTVNRKNMMDKRLGKIKNLRIKNAVKVVNEDPDADLTIISMGYTGGTIEQACIKLAEDGVKTSHLMVRQLYPLPVELLEPHLKSAKKVVVIENNATGQLAGLIKRFIGYHDKIHSVLKYDGTPFLPSEVYKACKELN
jgi:2-oxoglutarate ferredoxin oxidoreductase subunit alpha